MNKGQKFTPKYWVGHDTKSDDVFKDTLFKSRDDSERAMEVFFGQNWEDDNPTFRLILIEIKIVVE